MRFEDVGIWTACFEDVAVGIWHRMTYPLRLCDFHAVCFPHLHWGLSIVKKGIIIFPYTTLQKDGKDQSFKQQ